MTSLMKHFFWLAVSLLLTGVVLVFTGHRSAAFCFSLFGAGLIACMFLYSELL